MTNLLILFLFINNLGGLIMLGNLIKKNKNLNIFLVDLDLSSQGSDLYEKLKSDFIEKKIYLLNHRVNFLEISTEKQFIELFNSSFHNFVIQLDEYEIYPKTSDLLELSKIKYYSREEQNCKNSNCDSFKTKIDKENYLLDYFKESIKQYNFQVTFCYISVANIPKIENSTKWYDEASSSYQKPSLNNYLKSHAKLGRIIFWGRKYESKDDKEKKIKCSTPELITDLQAILTAYILSVVYDIYSVFDNSNNSNWADKILHSIDYGISLIDCNGYIIWANKRRKTFHKNNIIGKRCLDIVNCNVNNNQSFVHCIDKWDSSKKYNTNRLDDLKVEDYKGRSYYVSVVNSAFLDNNLRDKRENKHLCIVKVVRKTYDKSIIDIHRHDLTTANSYDSFLQQCKETFKDLSYSNFQFFEAGIDVTQDSVFDTDFNILIKKELGDPLSNSSIVIPYKQINKINEIDRDFYKRVTVLDHSEFSEKWFNIKKDCRCILIPLVFQKKQIGIIIIDNDDNLTIDGVERHLPEVHASYTSFSAFLSAAIFGIQEREVSKRLLELGHLCDVTVGAKNIITTLLKQVCSDLQCISASVFQFSPNKLEKQIERKEIAFSRDIPSPKKSAEESYSLGDNITGFYVNRCKINFNNITLLPLLNIVNLSNSTEFIRISKVWDNMPENERIKINQVYLDQELEYCIQKELIKSKNTDIQLLFCPLICDNAIIGCIRFLNYGEKPFSKMDMQVVKAISSHIAIIINDAWKSDENDVAIWDIVKILNKNYSSENLISQICKNIQNKAQCDFVAIHKIDTFNNRLNPYFSASTSDSITLTHEKLPTIELHTAKFNLIIDSFKKNTIDNDLLFLEHNQYCLEEIFGYIDDTLKGVSYPKYDPLNNTILLFIFSREEIKIGSFIAFIDKNHIVSEEDKRFIKILLSFLRIALINSYEIDEKQASIRISTHEFDSLSSGLEALVSNMKEHINKYDIVKAKLNSEKLTNYGENKRFSLLNQLKDFGYENGIVVKDNFPEQLLSLSIFADSFKFQVDRTFTNDLDQPGKLRIKDSMTRICGLLSVLAQKKGVSIIVNCPDNLNNLEYNTYKKVFEICLYNILENAVKYSFEKTKILFSADMDSSFQNIIFAVSNTGIPIEENQTELIFKSGWRSLAAQKFVIGKGLGLSTVKQYLDKYYSGNISLTKLGNLTEFQIKIPLNKMEVKIENKI